MNRRSVGSRLGWVTALIAAVSLVASSFIATASHAAPPATLIGRDEADRIALAALAPQNIQSRVAVFGLDGALKKGTRLGQDGPSTKADARIVRNKAGRSTVRKMRPVILKSDSWVVWMDLAPGAYFEHPSVLLAVDARTGRIASRLSFWWGPEVNLRPVTFSRTLYATPEPTPPAATAADQGPPQTFASGVVHAFLHAASWLSPIQLLRSQPAGATNPSRFANECIIVLRDPADPLFTNSDKLIEDLADSMLVRKKNASNRAELEKAIVDLTTKDPRCEDVTIWITAHGYAGPNSNIKGPNGASAIEMDVPAVKLGPEPGAMFGQTVFTIQDFREVMKRFCKKKTANPGKGDCEDPGNHTPKFKLIIESCFAGRWTEEFEKSKPNNLRTVEASSNSAEESFGYDGGIHVQGTQSGGKIFENGQLLIDFGENNKAKAGWFTYHMVIGIKKWIQEETARGQRGTGTGDGPSGDLGKGIDRAFDLGYYNDFMAVLGWTHPIALHEGDKFTSPLVPPAPGSSTAPTGGGGVAATPGGFGVTTPSTTSTSATSTTSTSTSTSTATTSTTTTTISSAAIVLGVTGPVVESATAPASTSTTAPPSSSTTSSTTTLPASTTTTLSGSTTTTVTLATVISVVANVCVLHAAVDSLLSFLIRVTVGGVPASGMVMSSISGGGVNHMQISVPLDSTGMAVDSVVITQQVAYMNQVSYGAAMLTTNFTVGPHTNLCPATAA